MAYLLGHLTSGWAVDQAILNEEERVVVVRFGHDYDPICMQMDEVLSGELLTLRTCLRLFHDGSYSQALLLLSQLGQGLRES
jgi:Mitosis protein DIM1